VAPDLVVFEGPASITVAGVHSRVVVRAVRASRARLWPASRDPVPGKALWHGEDGGRMVEDAADARFGAGTSPCFAQRGATVEPQDRHGENDRQYGDQ
jgi:hypothetical protein